MPHILKLVNRKPPETLYHYTGFDGAIGIVHSNEIWMGNLFFLNDEQEYLLGLRLFLDELEKRKSSCKNSGVKIFLDTLDSIEKLLRENVPFVFSLTEERDLISQWRAYTGGGGGVSIGFDTRKFLPDMKVLPCIYDPLKQKEYISYLLDSAIRKFGSTPENNVYDKAHCKDTRERPYWDAINQAGSKFISELNVACSIIKHPAFEEEKEWRLIKFGKIGVDFLSRNTFIKPTHKTKYSENGNIVSVMVGPNSNIDLCYASVCEMVKASTNPSAVVSKSSIPYRV